MPSGLSWDGGDAWAKVTFGRLTRGRIPAEIVYGARKVKTR